jgi:hypothetical protein
VEDSAGNDVVIFAGPTISRREIESRLAARVFPPAKRGDVYAASKQRPRAIAIIDGYFDQTPAVWHKEILWALSQGIEVFGSSSMGALRAAELRSFGMVGVGEIYEAYTSGDICRDDFVVVTHATSDEGYRSLSEAFVNIRWTLRAAEKEGVLTIATRAELEGAAERTFYPERSFSGLIGQARRMGVSSAELTGLERWLPRGRIDQKRADAELLLERLAGISDGERAPKGRFEFQNSDSWDRFRSHADLAQLAAETEARVGAPSRFAELSPVVRDGAILRAIAIHDAKTRGARIAKSTFDLAVVEFRRERGLLDEKGWNDWIDANFTSESALTNFFMEETLVRRLRFAYEILGQTHVANELIARGVRARDPGTAAVLGKPASSTTYDSSERPASREER